MIANKGRSTLPLSSLVADYKESVGENLPSFAAIRQHTLDTLYPAVDDSNEDGQKQHEEDKKKKDKSPKGSVDEGIQDLVNLINHHPSFATLSSCSGRISLFDPNQRHQRNGSQQENEEEEPITATAMEHSNSITNGGKGGPGGWLLVSHEEIQANKLLNVLQHQEKAVYKNDSPSEDNLTPMTLNFEPMLLHIAASNLSRGQQLLQLALQLGFRESGLVVTDRRVTVAIRSYALALSIPLQNNSSVGDISSLQLTNSYLTAFVDLANQRLQQNSSRIQQLLDGFAKQFFVLNRPKTEIIVSATQSLPGLFLWGHASVAIPRRIRNHKTPRAEIWVFGGFGPGPKQNGAGTSCRSSKVYKIGQLQGDSWDPEWEEMNLACGSNDGKVICCGGLDAIPSLFTAREGLKAVDWSDDVGVTDDDSENISIRDDPTILLFGGRQSPAKPLDELLLFQCMQQLFLKPTDVRGTPPGPRWGHSLTRMGARGDDKKRCFLFGGRNETTTFSDGYVLQENNSQEGTSHLLWTKVDFSTANVVPRPRFHHSCCIVDDDCLLLLGGMDASNTLVGTMTNSGKEARQDKSNAQLIQFGTNHVALPVDCGDIRPMFAEDLWSFSVHGGDKVFLATGGLPVEPAEADSIVVDNDMLVRCFSLHRGKNQQQCKLSHEHAAVSGKLDLSALVHHTCVVIPRPAESSVAQQQVAVIGGGAQGFAFGPHFAPSSLLTVRLSSRNTVTDAVNESSRDLDQSPRESNVHGHGQSVALPKSVPTTSDPYVAYVAKRNAHKLRSSLETLGLLDRRFRMTTANESMDSKVLDHPTQYIAVPIKLQAHQLLQDQIQSSLPVQQQPEWCALVQALGQRAMPLSTATFAAKPKK